MITATVVGSGPNGLAAAITLARGGCAVTVLEAQPTFGGGTRSAELTVPGFIHDVCSAIHPLGVASPFFRSLPLADLGLEWIHPPVPLAHPLDDADAAVLDRSVDVTADDLGPDAAGYRRLYAPLVAECAPLLDALLAPLIPPHHVLTLARFGVRAIRSAQGLARAHFQGERAQALTAGIAAHSLLPLDALASGSFALLLGTIGHAWGWPFPRGGSQAIANALVRHLQSLGGTVVTDHAVTSAAELVTSDIVMFDLTPRQIIAIARDRLPAGYRGRLERYRYGPAVFKLDWALRGPIPWRDAACAQAATVHVGGTLAQISASEAATARGQIADRPFVLLTQPSRFDDSRAPHGRQTAWAYCHVPNGSSTDMTDRIERQVERFAPGFRDLVLARHVMTPSSLEQHNANYIGGDIVGGANDLMQLVARPMLRWNPYAMPVKGWYICSASTPPGGGVHGMAGFHAAQSALDAHGLAT